MMVSEWLISGECNGKWNGYSLMVNPMVDRCLYPYHRNKCVPTSTIFCASTQRFVNQCPCLGCKALMENYHWIVDASNTQGFTARREKRCGAISGRCGMWVSIKTKSAISRYLCLSQVIYSNPLHSNENCSIQI